MHTNFNLAAHLRLFYLFTYFVLRHC